ncbi:MFS transporter [Kitasatospora nipponensis]|uniref:MFS transporter n=1 Tax=Kitasatospora nipponensis TaxID=258049 RepID=A0ABN1VU63_9ACTN
MALINRNFTLLWSGQAVSQTGDFVFDTTLTLWVGTQLLAGSANAPAAVSGLLITVAVATLLVAPLAGVYVDRWDYRRTMLGTDLIRAALIGAVAAMAFLPGGTVPTGVQMVVVYAAVFANSAVSQFFTPARFAIINDVVGAEERGRAAAIGQSTQAIASILGPPLAAPLLYAAGVQWALAVNALSYLVSFVLVRAVDIPPHERPETAAAPDFRAEFVDGLRTSWRNPVVRVLLLVIALISVGIGALNTVNVFFVTDNLHVDVRWFGTLDMALGIGLLVGAACAARLLGRFGNERTFSFGLLVMGVLLLGYSRMTSFWPALVLIALIGPGLSALNAAVAPLLLGAVPQQYLGRVFSVINPVQQVASVIGMGLAGWLASSVLRGFHGQVGGLPLGRIDTILGGAALLVVVGAGYSLLALRAPVAPVAAADQAAPADQAAQLD